MKEETSPIGEQILYQQGSFAIKRRFYRGWEIDINPHQERVQGWSGPETMVEGSVIRPLRVFKVKG